MVQSHCIQRLSTTTDPGNWGHGGLGDDATLVCGFHTTDSAKEALGGVNVNTPTLILPGRLHILVLNRVVGREIGRFACPFPAYEYQEGMSSQMERVWRMRSVISAFLSCSKDRVYEQLDKSSDYKKGERLCG